MTGEGADSNSSRQDGDGQPRGPDPADYASRTGGGDTPESWTGEQRYDFGPGVAPNGRPDPDAPAPADGAADPAPHLDLTPADTHRLARDHSRLAAALLPPGAKVMVIGDGPAAHAAAGELHAAGFETERRPLHKAGQASASPGAGVRHDGIAIPIDLNLAADHELLDVLYQLRSGLAPGGVLVATLAAGGRPLEQYRFFLSRLGLDLLRAEEGGGGGWMTALFKDAGGEGLRPIETLESILVEDRKVNSYKYALLRALANLAMHRYNAVEWLPDGAVAVPVRRIADEWIASYWPLIEVDADAHPSRPPRILQGQKIRGKADLVFREALRELAGFFHGAGGYAAFSRARDAGQLSPEAEQAYANVLRKLRPAIGQPVQYAGNLRTGGKVFRMEKGHVILPGALWSELSIMGRWVTDSIVLRWAEFTVNLRHQSPDLTREAVLSLLMPEDNADRDVATAQDAYRRAAARDNGIESAWTGRRITRFDVDHAIPFSLWGNNDLWNLLPAEPEVNRKKGAGVPTRGLVEARRGGILQSWEILYEGEPGLFLAHSGAFVGEGWEEFGKRQEDELFSTFKDAIEYTARNRVAARWAG